eukprot:3381151-Lingulodinium_polyedra.AAC.1
MAKRLLHTNLKRQSPTAPAQRHATRVGGQNRRAAGNGGLLARFARRTAQTARRASAQNTAWPPR